MRFGRSGGEEVDWIRLHLEFSKVEEAERGKREGRRLALEEYQTNRRLCIEEKRVKLNACRLELDACRLELKGRRVTKNEKHLEI